MCIRDSLPYHCDHPCFFLFRLKYGNKWLKYIKWYRLNCIYVWIGYRKELNEEFRVLLIITETFQTTKFNNYNILELYLLILNRHWAGFDGKICEVISTLFLIQDWLERFCLSVILRGFIGCLCVVKIHKKSYSRQLIFQGFRKY